MSARCVECGEHVSSEPYPDEKQLAEPCSCCEGYLCEDCAIREGGICTECKRVLAEP